MKFLGPVLSVFALVALAALPVERAHAASADDAGKYVESLAKQTLSTISDKGRSKEQKSALLQKLFSNNVDIPWVGRFVMGRFWRTASDSQKKQYLAEYQKFLIQHYTDRFTDYTSGSFKVTGSKDDGDSEYTVSMVIQASEAGSDPINVDYKVRKDGNSYKIFDVIVEGVSMITTQRSEFASVLNQHDVDFLIAQLQSKSIVISDK